MKKITTLFTMAIVLSAFALQAATIIVTGPITTNTTWNKNNIYILRGFVYVKNNATLTIQEGTLIKGEKATKGSLIIERGSKLIAIGKVNKPIVFTSDQPAGQRAAGDWGGVILLGNAPLNVPGGTAVIEGGIPASDGTYGGNDPADNSGTLKYVRIEFPGIAYQPNSEINGLTLGGVGTGTDISYVQVSYSGDDSFEWFGGAVNGKYLIAYRAVDDDFDSDFGYQGKNQFLLSKRDPNIADVSTSHVFESDNDASGSANTPKTAPQFCNITAVGPMQTSASSFNALFTDAAHIRRNTELKLYNSLIMGWPKGYHIDGTACESNATANLIRYKNNIMAQVPGTLDYLVNSGSPFNIYSWVASQGGNDTITDNATVKLNNPWHATAPKFDPKTGSPALTGASFAGLDPFFVTTTYRGAFAKGEDWTNCWATFDPQNANYTSANISYAYPTTTVSASGPLTFCAGGSVTLCAVSDPNYTYQWYKGAAAITSATSSCYTATTAGKFYCKITHATSGCKANTAKKTVVINCREEYNVENAPIVSVFPNPVSESATFKFNVFENSNIQINMYDITGKQVAVAVNGSYSEGDHEVSFDATQLPAGFYSAQVIINGEMAQALKIQVVKY